MSASRDVARDWPTLAYVRDIAGALSDAEKAVEWLDLELHGVIDADAPYETPRVMPTVEHVAAMTALADRLDGHLRDLSRSRERIVELRDVAAFHVLQETSVADRE